MKHRLLGPALSALVVTLVAAAMPAVAAPTFLVPSTPLSAPDTSGEQADVGVDAAGNAIAVWRSSHNGGATYVLEFATRQAGGSWSDPSPVTAQAINVDASGPQLAVNAAGDAVVVWRDLVAGGIAGSYLPAGGEWGDRALISSSGGNPTDADVAISATGDVVATYTTFNDTVGVASRAASTGAWAIGTVLTAEEGIVERPVVAATPDGVFTVAWPMKIGSGGSPEIVYARSLAWGGTWGTRIPLSSSAADVITGDVDVASSDSGATVVAWMQGTGSAPATVVARVRPTPAADWGDAAVLSTGSADPSSVRPAVAMDPAGNATAVWCITNDDGTQVVQSSRRQAGGAWPAPADVDELSVTAQNALAPDVSMAEDGSAVAVWHLDPPDTAGPEPEVLLGPVQAARRSGLAGEWTVPEGLSAVDRLTDDAHVATDPEGNATLVWTTHEAAGADLDAAGVEATGLDAAPPSISVGSMPTIGTVGQPVSYAVTASDAWSAYSVSWSFGDGTSASGTAAVHTFTAPGTYTVAVTGIDAVGNSRTRTGTTTVTAPAGPPSPPASPPPGAPEAPALSGLKLTKTTIHVVGSDEKPRATKLKLTLNVEAKVVVKVQRINKLDGKTIKAKLTKAVAAGASSIKLTSKIKKRLPPGAYLVSVRATNAVGTAAAKAGRLRIEL